MRRVIGDKAPARVAELMAATAARSLVREERPELASDIAAPIAGIMQHGRRLYGAELIPRGQARICLHGMDWRQRGKDRKRRKPLGPERRLAPLP